MSSCEHQFVNTKYGKDGTVKVTCSTCRAVVTKPHHAVMARLYSPPSDQVD
jgi:hypothetical protein